MKKKRKKINRDTILENEIASLIRKYNIKQAIDIIFPNMRWVFYFFFLSTVATIILFVTQEIKGDFYISSFSLIKTISLLSLTNIAVLTFALLIKRKLYLAKKLYLLRLFISILTGWLLFFASEDFWKIEFDNTDSSYIMLVVTVILVIITFFMTMEIKSLIAHKRVLNRVIIIMGIASIISINIGIFFMPDVLKGILDNSEFMNKNELYYKHVIEPLDSTQMHLAILDNRISKYKIEYSILLDQAKLFLNIGSQDIQLEQKYVVEENPNLIVKFGDKNKADFIKELETLEKSRKQIIDSIKNDKVIDKENIYYLHFINSIEEVTKKNKKWKNQKENTEKEIKYLENSKKLNSNKDTISINKSIKNLKKKTSIQSEADFFIKGVLEDNKSIVAFSSDLTNKLLQLEKEINTANDPKEIRTWLSKDHNKVQKVLINGVWIKGKVQYHPKLLIFQTFLAMFVGVFMQLLIQDKTVTESI